MSAIHVERLRIPSLAQVPDKIPDAAEKGALFAQVVITSDEVEIYPSAQIFPGKISYPTINLATGEISIVHDVPKIGGITAEENRRRLAQWNPLPDHQWESSSRGGELPLQQHLSPFWEDGQVLAWTDVYEKYKGVIKNKVKFSEVPAEGVEDMLHDIFFKVVRAADRFDNNRKLSTWLLGISKNHCIDLHRKKFRNGIDSLESLYEVGYEPTKSLTHNDDSSIEDRVNYGEDIENTLELILEISPSCRSIFILNRVFDLPLKEAATVLGIPEGAAKMRLHRANKQFLALSKKDMIS